MAKRKRVWLVVLAVVLIAAVGLAATKLLGRRSTSNSSLTQVWTVQRGNLTASLTLTGEVSPQQRVELSFDVSKIPLTEVNVKAGQTVKKGDVLAKIETESLQRAVDQAKANLLSAEDALESAKTPYTELDKQKAELDVAQAEAAQEEAKLATADQELRDAESALQQAKDKLVAVQNDVSTKEQIERLQWQYNIVEVEHGKLLDGNTSEEANDRRLLAYNRMMDAKDNLVTAQTRAALDLLNVQNAVTQAEEKLAALKANSQGGAEAQVRLKVAQAEYNLAKAKETLEKIEAGPEEKAVQLAQGKYDAAKATLAEAEATLASATMVAPFDGTVISVGAEVGDEVSSGTVVVTLADLTSLKISASVDESEISQVAVGQEATITFDAFTGKTMKGKVLEVPLEGSVVNSVVSYDVPLSLEGAEGIALKSGMTANVKLQVGSRQNALLVPVLAVKQSEDGDVVMVQDASSGAVETRIETGLSNGTYVEVVKGLNEGDQVVVQYTTTTEEENTMGGFEMGGGGMPSGGAPPSGGPPGQ